MDWDPILDPNDGVIENIFLHQHGHASQVIVATYDAYRSGIRAGGRTRGSSLIVPVGSRVSTFFAVPLSCALPVSALLTCALPAPPFAFALAGGVSTDCR